MSSMSEVLRQRFALALQVVVPDRQDVDPLLRETNDKNFGDYQSNVAMSLAKALKKNPRELATQIMQNLNVADVCSKIEIAGPGFINLTLNPNYIAEVVKAMGQNDRMGVEKVAKPLHHILDFSSPNVAKEMHVGHLRSTITGEVIARIIEFQGHTIERINHIGDWGTQFGMLLQCIYEKHPDVLNNPDLFRVNDLEAFYKEAKKRFDEDESFANEARQKVVLLQSGDATALKLWRVFVTESLRHCHEIYRQLDVTLKDVGESFYNDRLPKVVDELLQRGLAVEDKGAVCVFLDGYVNREGEPLPFIIRKSDGGYNYATTDLAAMKYRLQERKADRIVIITDIRQAQHFEMLFATTRKLGWADSHVELHHIGYGMVLGADKKPFKTRSGDTVRLKDLIHESIERSRAVIQSNAESQNWSEEKIQATAQAVGLAAVKYFDLSHNLSSDYVFSWDHMLAMDGNTGPYMLYAYARIQSIGRKANVDLNQLSKGANLILEQSCELDLAKALLRFGDTLRNVARELKPNLLTEYLYDLSKTFNTFYDRKLGVRIVDAETEALKQSRLLLCSLTAKTLKLGLSLLSIHTVDEM